MRNMEFHSSFYYNITKKNLRNLLFQKEKSAFGVLNGFPYLGKIEFEVGTEKANRV